MLKKLAAISLSIVMAASMLAGCGSSGKDNSADKSATTSAASTAAAEKEEKKEPIEITVWHTGPEDTAADSNHTIYKNIAAKYIEENSYVTVTVTGNKALDKVLTAVSSGQGPDIFMNQWPNVATWSDKGALLDLTDFVNNDAEFDKADIINGAWERAIYKDKIYGIPTQIYSSEIYYNKDLLAEAGYTAPPETMEELVEMAIKLTKYDDKGNVIQAGYIPDHPWLDNVLWPVAYGAKWIDPETNKITFDTPEMAAAYQWQVDIYDAVGRDKLMRFKTGLGKLEGGQDPFIAGKLAMMFSGEWVFSNVATAKSDINYGVAPIPYPKDHPELKGSMFITTAVWNVSATTKVDKNEVWKFLSYFTSKESYKEFAKGMGGAGQLMARKSAMDALPDTVNPMLKDVAKMLQSPNATGFPMLAYVNEYLTAINDEMTLALNGKKSVADAQKAVVEKIQPLADKNPLK